jgi:hypothetical protein
VEDSQFESMRIHPKATWQQVCQSSNRFPPCGRFGQFTKESRVVTVDCPGSASGTDVVPGCAGVR